MSTRARGANALLDGKFESAYGTPPSGNWARLPFVSSDLGEERGLIESDLLGQGRDPFDPTYDVANDAGDLTVPVDARNSGYWFKLYFGAPTSGAGDAATGSISFSDQPAADSTLTINGATWTFKSSGASGAQSNIGVSLAATLTALATALNASANTSIDDATYVATSTALTITHDTAGVAGNAFTLAASAGSNGTVSGATLSGGNYSHVFTSGSASLPSMALQLAHPEHAAPYHVHYGVCGNTLAIAMQRSGLLNMVLGLIAQGELPTASSSSAGTPTVVATDRFAQAVGEITLDGQVLGNVVSSDFRFGNNLDKVETIRSDGRIDGLDPGMTMAGGTLVMRYADQVLLDAATAGDPVAVTRGWVKGAASLLISTPRLFLPRFKTPVQGPQGLQVTANVQASKPSGSPMVTVTLKNDVASYA